MPIGRSAAAGRVDTYWRKARKYIRLYVLTIQLLIINSKPQICIFSNVYIYIFLTVLLLLGCSQKRTIPYKCFQSRMVYKRERTGALLSTAMNGHISYCQAPWQLHCVLSMQINKCMIRHWIALILKCMKSFRNMIICAWSYDYSIPMQQGKSFPFSK